MPALALVDAPLVAKDVPVAHGTLPHLVRDAPAAVSVDSGINRRTVMQDYDDSKQGPSDPFAPLKNGNSEGIPYPILQWKTDIPSGQQVCGSNDDDTLRICCSGTTDFSDANRPMCLTDQSPSDLYDCIQSKSHWTRAIGVACSDMSSGISYTTKQGTVHPQSSSVDPYNNLSAKQSSAGRKRVGLAVLVLSVAAALI